MKIAGEQFVVQAQYRFCIGEDDLAVRSKRHAAGLVMEQGLAGNIFKSLSCRLIAGCVRPRRRAVSVTLPVSATNKRSQHSDIKAEKVHRVVPRAQWLGPAATSMHASAVQTRDLPCTKFVHLSAPKALPRRCGGYDPARRRLPAGGPRPQASLRPSPAVQHIN